MLEKVDLSKSLSKDERKEILEKESTRLALLQRECKEAGIPVMIIFDGMGAAGKGTQIGQLIQPLDPRGFQVYSINRKTEDEAMRPFLWRFWTRLPEQGRIALFDRSWYSAVMTDRFDGITKPEDVPRAFEDIRSFEAQLVHGGYLIIKLFLYISKEEQKKRLKKLADSKETAWRTTEDDFRRNKHYEEYLQMLEEMLQQTDTDLARWNIIEAEDRDFAAVKIMSTVNSRLQYELERRKAAAPAPVLKEDRHFKLGALSAVDLTKSLDRDDYKKQLDFYQKKLELLHNELYRLRIPVILGFEGWDAGGKGGAIKRLTSHLDPRGYAVHPTAAPNDTERKYHYLWRFWNHFPKAGHIAIFDRTWYGRVMVERIEGFCTQEDWKRAYQEINEMESHLVNSGAIVIKFWLQIDKDEQERRFTERMNTPEKQWKITDEDWRNREKWDQYEEAVDEMLVRTSTAHAPWVIIEGNDKYYARVKVLRTVVEAMEAKIQEVKKMHHKKQSD